MYKYPLVFSKYHSIFCQYFKKQMIAVTRMIRNWLCFKRAKYESRFQENRYCEFLCFEAISEHRSKILNIIRGQLPYTNL